jgi:hypothetical protein
LVAISKRAEEVQETDIEGLSTLQVGQTVSHPKFGRGVIEGLFIFSDGTKTVRVEFGGMHGSTALLQKHAQLKLLK